MRLEEISSFLPLTQRYPAGKFTNMLKRPKKTDTVNAELLLIPANEKVVTMAPSLTPHPAKEIGILANSKTGGNRTIQSKTEICIPNDLAIKNIAIDKFKLPIVDVIKSGNKFLFT